MPRFDGTGPMGRGPLTGRGMGPCGGGMRCGLGYRRTYTKAEEKEILQEDSKALEEELKAIKARLAEL